MNDLEKTRKEIDGLDREMAELFEKRMRAAEKIAEYKKQTGLPVYDEKRENAVIAKNSAYVSDDGIRGFYVQFIKNVMELSRGYQTSILNGVKVAFSGVSGAYAEIAAKKMFPYGKTVAYPDFASAYEAVEKGECDYAVLPVENSYAGDVGTVMDLIFSGSLFVNRMFDLSVKHNLVAVKGATRDNVKTVISHPQALSQCASYVKKQGFKVEEAENTALAAKYVAEKGDKSVAAIASEETAALYGLEIIDAGINASAGNTTRFAAFSRSMSTTAPADKASGNFILTFTVKNEAGSLAKTLDIIGAHGYNMRNLRSRPMKKLLWSYYFYIEAEGNVNTPDGRDMLKELGATCDRLKLAGTYSSYGD